jgi:diguanylate cyclase (GGDEF)-like protein
MHARVWWLLLVLAALAVGGYFLLPVGWAQTATGAAVGLAGAAAVVAGVRTARPRHAVAWYLLAAGLVLEVAGDVVYAWYSLALGEPDRFPSWPDACYLAGCPLIGAALVLMVRSRTGRDRAGLIDAAIVASGVGLLSWVFLMAPIAETSALSLSGRLVSLAYPVWDVLFLALVIRLLAGGGARVPAMRLLVAASGTWLVADTMYAVLLQYGAYTQDHFMVALWNLGFVLFGAAALHPSMGQLTQPTATRGTRLTRPRLALLTAVSLTAPTVLLLQAVLARGAVDGVAIGVASVLLFLLVVLRMVGLLRQVEDQAEELSALARHDALTGVPNRRTWNTELPVALDRARRDGTALAVALLDVDRFKAFNDEYGHQAGDRLLKGATAAWSGGLRSVDLLCRYGGEEFGILLPGATPDEAAEVVDRLRALTPLAQTFSAGVAGWDGRESSDELVGRADRATYAAKQAGRNQVTVAEPPAGGTVEESPRHGTESTASVAPGG